jgi:Acyltransferase family
MIDKALPRVGHSLARTSPWIDCAASRAAYRSEIDGLRALAVVPVVLYHAGFPIFGGGFVGVDVFFVISGYLITGNIYAEMARDRFSIIDFYERRVRRILPALYLVMIASLPFAWLWLSRANSSISAGAWSRFACSPRIFSSTVKLIISRRTRKHGRSSTRGRWRSRNNFTCFFQSYCRFHRDWAGGLSSYWRCLKTFSRRTQHDPNPCLAVSHKGNRRGVPP